MSRILQRNTALEWEHYRDSDRYHPLRDGPRLYTPVWVVSRMERYLPPDQVSLAKRLHTIALWLEGGASPATLDRVDSSPHAHLTMTERRTAKVRELEGYERAAQTRVGHDGKLCYRGIIGGDGQAELARRVRYPESSTRALRKLVQITLAALGAYRDENERDAGVHNFRAAGL